MSRILLYRDNYGLVLSVEDNSFTDFSEFVRFINRNKLNVVKYEKNNLYLEVANFKIKIENFQRVIVEPELQEFRKKLSSIYFNKKMTLCRTSHKKTIINSKLLASIALSSVLIASSVHNISFDSTKSDFQIQEEIISEISLLDEFPNHDYLITRLNLNHDDLKKYEEQFELTTSQILNIIADVYDYTQDFDLSTMIENEIKFRSEISGLKSIFPDLSNSDFKDYCYDFGLDYDKISPYISENKSYFENNKMLDDEFAIKLFLYDFTNDLGVVRTHNYDKSQIEELLINEFLKYGVDDPETLTTMLAVFRTETGHGTSNLLFNGNNFGGHKRLIVENDKKVSVNIIYATPEIGVFRFFEVFERIKSQAYDKCLKDGLNVDNMSLEEIMSRIYAPGDETWLKLVKDLKFSVKDDYDSFEKGRSK